MHAGARWRRCIGLNWFIRLKPHNVLRCKGDKVKVIDFGQRRKVGYGKNRVQGTPDFIAPEQVKCQAVDEKTDIYSFRARRSIGP